MLIITYLVGIKMIHLYPYQALLTIVGNYFDAHSVSFFVAQSNDKNSVQLLTYWCPAEKLIDNFLVESGRGYVGWVLRNSAPLLVKSDDLQNVNIDYYESYPNEVQSFMACPVLEKNVLCVDSRRENAFDENSQKMLELFASLFGEILKYQAQSSLTSQVSTYYSALEAMHDHYEKYNGWTKYLKNCLQTISEASGYEYVSFVSHPEESPNYIIEAENVPLVLINEKPVEISVQSGTIGWVIRNEENIFNDGLTQTSTPLYGKIKDIPDFCSTICKTIKVNNTVIATIALASRNSKNITPQLRSFIRTACGNITQAVERLHLRHKMQEIATKKQQ